MTNSEDLLDEFSKGCERPEDLPGDAGPDKPRKGKATGECIRRFLILLLDGFRRIRHFGLARHSS